MFRFLFRIAVILSLPALVCCGKDDAGGEPPAAVNPDAVAPVMERFALEMRYNSGLAANVTCRIDASAHTITGSVKGHPMIKETCMFVPTFAVPENHKVYIGDRVQTSGLSRVDLSGPVTYRVVNENGDEASYTVTMQYSFTGLPVVAINTVAGASVTSKDYWVKATVSIDGAGEYDDIADAGIEIAGRGNSTWYYPKKPYKIRFGERTSVLGMPKHKRWVLLANYNDRTMLRNDVAFYLGRQTSLAWTPHGVFVELVLNNRHAGTYYLCEQVRIDKNRVAINEMKPYAGMAAGDDITGGYLLELDSYFDEDNKFRSALRSLPVNVKAPDADDIGTAQFNYIRDWFNEAERVLYSDGWLDPGNGYRKYIDVDSFVDMYLVAELIYHYEWRHPKSTYMYKDSDANGGRLCMGPMWDYDWRTFSVGAGWYARNYMWYPRLMQDPDFVAQVKSRWTALYPKFAAAAGYIPRMERKIAPSAAVNWSMWTDTAGENDDRYLPYSEAVSLMQSRFRTRLEWLNGEINRL